MMERRCDCAACRARRLAIWMLVAALAIMIGVGIHIDSRAATPAAASAGSSW